MSKFSEGWYLIYTKPKHEKKVCTRLTELRIVSFLPTRKSLRKWHDRKKYIDEPLFPSYVFVYLTDLQSYYHSIDVDGSLFYVRTGNIITRISEATINNIKLITHNAETVEVSEAYFCPGQKLVIAEGALAGLSCELVRYNDKQTLLVRMDLLKRNLLLTLPAGYLTCA
ncbi:UpxY family transcription antiterminator [Chitinophaga solisilvae]|uniref:UpxY family transcription antiterminator n=1 Tax=Chitinophaga solisilvae TaxID=1233460 RepID=UPI001371EC7D|nr:UpxY family transcription antiterminator [Chitinophaga solisilvae]